MTSGVPKTFLEIAAGVIGEEKVAEIMNRPFADMVERVARAIWNNPAKCDLRNVSVGPCALGEDCTCWPAILNVARTAIAAMRTPTPEMVETVKVKLYGQGPGDGMGWFVEPWQAGIDAALKDS